MWRIRIKLAGIFLLLLTTGVLFQNCTQRVDIHGGPPSAPRNNGGPYAGMTAKTFRHFDTAQICSARDLLGKPLPNNEILFKYNAQGNGGMYLARENCRDLPPVLIPEADVQIADGANNSVIYKNNFFTADNPPGDFDTVAAVCPAGRSPKAGAMRTNLFAYAFDWTMQMTGASAGWYTFPGISTSLFSTIASLPAFLIERNDPQNLDYFRRNNQQVNLQENTEYAFSFLAQTGSVAAADLEIYRENASINPPREGAQVTFDFQNQTAQIRYNRLINNLSATIVPVENGFLCTVYFTSGANSPSAGKLQIGVSPSTAGALNGKLGDSVIATAAQLVSLSEFCQ